MLARTIITAMLSIILMLGAVGSSAAQEKSDPRAKTGGGANTGRYIGASAGPKYR